MQSKWVAFGRGLIRVMDSLINWMILACMLPLLMFGLYANWDTMQIYHKADNSQFEQFKPVYEEEIGLEDIQKINSDVYAWLTIYGTNIDYPVVRGITNDSYINTDVYGKYSLSGSIFLDYRNRINFQDFNSIIYGHHMENKVMFGEIDTFRDASVFNEKRYGNVYYDGKNHGLEIMAYLSADAYDFTLYAPAVEVNQQEYLDYVLSLAVHSRNIEELSVEDSLVLLSTCSQASTNGRDLLLCRIVDETFEDPFVVEIVKPTFRVDVGGVAQAFGNIPDNYWIYFFAGSSSLLFIFFIWRTVRRWKKKRERKNVTV